MGKWADRLTEKTFLDHSEGTAKTAKRGVLSVLAVPLEWISAEIQPANDCTTPAPTAELLALLADDQAPARTCSGCQHLTRRKTCTEPAAAGLDPPPGHHPGADWFGIRWPAMAYGATCPAFQNTTP